MSTTLVQNHIRLCSSVGHAAARRVLVAVVLHSDDEGLTCRASDAILVDSASVSPDELADALNALKEAGWIRTLILPEAHPSAGRVIVLMDHEAAGWYLRETFRSIRAIDHDRR